MTTADNSPGMGAEWSKWSMLPDIGPLKPDDRELLGADNIEKLEKPEIVIQLYCRRHTGDVAYLKRYGQYLDEPSRLRCQESIDEAEILMKLMGEDDYSRASNYLLKKNKKAAVIV